MKTTVKTSWIALFASVAAASPAALPDSERPSAVRRRGRSAAMAVSITASVPEAVESQVKARARARAASPMAARSSWSLTSSRTPATSSAGSSASSPVCRSTIASPSPPTRIAAVGVAHAPASSTVRHQPSADEAVSATQARASSRAFSSSSTWPWKVTRSRSPRSSTAASSARRWSPSPAMSRCASGIASSTSNRSSMRLYCFRRPR